MTILKHYFGLIPLALALGQFGNAAQDMSEEDITSSVLYAPVPTNRLSLKTPINLQQTYSDEQKPICHNYRTNFATNLRGWQVENSMQDTYEILENSIQFNLLPPDEYIRLHDERHMPYNQIGGRGPTLNSTVYMRYGKMSANIKAAGTGGSVTAFILMGDGGDEIDFEFIGGDYNHVQYIQALDNNLCYLD
ncbi:hypothetical protein G6F35_014363 [Rhizopus arrhizus]|nr:hypothetical protein G6F35_014363 [Rhizopus arrhizus]